MKYKKYFLPLLFAGLIFSSCLKDHEIDKQKYGNCTDGIQNQGETNIDCGGVCADCMSCTDGIKNQGETGIDCGGPCQSCAPPCTLPASSCNYTLYPSGFTFSLSGTTSSTGGYYSANNHEITIYLNGPDISDITIGFKDTFDPIAFISLNQTMVFTTIDFNSTIVKNSQVEVKYSGNIGFNSYNGAMDANQSVFITKISATSVQVRFCSLSAGSERVSVNAVI